MGKFYAVRKGYSVGVFNTWAECEKQVKGFKGAEFKSFKTKEEADVFINGGEEVEIYDENCLVGYVDGSYEDSIKRFGSGIVILKNGEVIHEKSICGVDESLLSMRNVAGEIKAAEYCMKYCLDNGVKDLILHFDYMGIEKWCTGEWKTNKEGTQKYRKTYLEYKEKGLRVKFVKVKAHSGDKYNDVADELAKKGVIL
ncbi:MAG: ribonuclease H family protein [Clostridium sp.]|uniref:ribonuclease H family protein n=1 Tax=Clostridium sp. TaxID=1506 RepID=UPI002FC74E78